jgi:hypothetical protein
MISGREREIRLAALAYDCSPFAHIEVTHRARRFVADARKSEPDFIADIRTSIVEIDPGADATSVIEKQSCLLSIPENVGKCKP